MNLFAYTCPYMENAMFIKRCYKLLQCINQCIIVVPVNLYLDNSYISKKASYRHRSTTTVGSENTSTFKTLLKS